ncbi:MAG: pilin [Steroidobacteraceae bacterium]|nr:pilin [Steroidobacteraceae bacterium]
MKASIAEFYANDGAMPADIEDVLGTGGAATDKAAKYVTQIDVTDGTITISYGNQANDRIDGETLSLVPFVNINGDVVWVCGRGEEPAAADLLNPQPTVGANGTSAAADFPDKYLPRVCRPA